MSGPPTFREALERLEAIVRELESNDVDLDRALTLFEEGVGHLKAARALLDTGEQKVRRVLAQADGSLATRDLDV